MTSTLFSPIKLADLALENRIVVSPMCQYSADDGSATDWHLGHLAMLANSGADLVVVEATHVERRGRITHGCLGLYSDDNEAALARVIAHCRRVGTAKLGIQLAHAGRKASSYRPWEGGLGLKQDDDPWETIAPSAIAFGNAWSAPRAMTRDDMDRVRDAFVASARRAVRLGFDAVELHMAHGYLLHSFMSPIANHRSDEYGGSHAARLRFPLEVARAVRAVVPPSLPLGARITGSDWSEGGLTPDDAVALAKALKEMGLDFLCVSSGGITAEVKIALGPGYQVPFAEKVRREVGIPTRAVGLIATPQQAEAILADGKADMIALARAMLDDPRWGWHAAQALAGDVKRPPQYARAAPKLAGSGLSRLTGAGGRETVEVRMVRSSAIAMLFAVMTLCACAEGASAKNARARPSAAHRSASATGQAVMRKKPPVAPTPRQDEKSWMDRASTPSDSGGGGGGM